MNIQPMGEGALLVETADAAAAQALRTNLLEQGVTGLHELVPGQRSLLVSFDPLHMDPGALAQRLTGLAAAPAAPVKPRRHEIGVRYDGEDLAGLARELHMEAAELVRRHAAPVYRVAFLGFAPGFPYLTGLDPALQAPRRGEPRVRVPAGSVAVAGEFTGIYPRATPGGWRLIGRTDVSLFDVMLSPPALFAPGDEVRFLVLP